MKLHKEDPRLTAYLLGELPPDEAAAVDRAVAEDPSLRIALAEMEKEQLALFATLGGETERLLPRQLANIRRAAKEAAREGKIVELDSHRHVRKPWHVPLAAAAAIGGLLFILTQFPAPRETGGNKNVSGNHTPDKDNGTGGHKDPDRRIPPVNENIVQLPLTAGRKSLPQIASAIRTESRMPTREEIRIPEMLNAFPLKANAAVALWDGCKLGAEILPSPWKPSASLVVVEIQGAKDGPRELSVEYRADDGSVIAHRLIGYANSTSGGAMQPVSKIEAKSQMLLVIEVESKDLKLGSLVWEVAGREAPAVPLLRDPAREPSDDARFASLICAFGLWLGGEDSAMIDDALVLGLARESAAANLAPDRYDLLNLIDEAAKLRTK
jgi:hypothetical protein